MSDKNIYWANLCVLNRKESELMETAADAWREATGSSYGMTYLGDTEEVKIHEKLEKDLETGDFSFRLAVSSRFDLFCSNRYLMGRKELLRPIGESFPIREEVKASGVLDPFGLYHPLVVLPHFIVVNTQALGEIPPPASLEDLLDDRWKGKVAVGNTDLPSGQSVLFSMHYLFGREGLEACIRNWRQKSAPSAVRHGLLKGEFAVGLLPGIFSGPGPRDELKVIRPKEGLPVLPSYAAVKDEEGWEDTVEFLRASAASEEFLRFYRDMAHGIASNPSVPLPAISREDDRLIFPDWKWILEQDVEEFKEHVGRMEEI